MTPDFAEYDKILVAFSGGKDSIACFLHLLELGVPAEKIELHHQDIDGDGPLFMDWACTQDYCRQFAAAFGVPLYRSWREGGFLREMRRSNSATAAIKFEDGAYQIQTTGGDSSKLGTRGLYPQKGNDLRTRWCSPSCKIDVFAAVIANQDRFLRRKTLVITGERAEESAARAKYETFEVHRTDTRNGPRRPRHVDHWRPVHGWSEAQVWDILRRFGVMPFVSYLLGFHRYSCAFCVFLLPGQLATLRYIMPDRFEEHVRTEADTGRTIDRYASLAQSAAKGTPHPIVLERPDLVAQANLAEWRLPITIPPQNWRHPAGAFSQGGGPS